MRFDEQRDTYLRAQVERGETVLAQAPAALVTDRRVLFAWRLNWPPHADEWIRVGSWLLLAVPAFLIRPWLVLPAILTVEVAWIVGLQWAWDCDRRRRALRP